MSIEKKASIANINKDKADKEEVVIFFNLILE
jgi:hypothetical protein